MQRLQETHTETNTTWRANPRLHRTVQQGWDAYWTFLVAARGWTTPATSEDVLQTETRRAFYMGAQATSTLLLDLTAEVGADLDAGAHRFERLRQELLQFVHHRTQPQPTPGTLAHAWAKYDIDILGDANAGPAQRRECRTAFYAGAGQIIDLFVLTGEDDVSVEEGAAYMESLRNELRRFYNEMIEGRA